VARVPEWKSCLNTRVSANGRPPDSTMPEIATINHVGVTVTDIERSTPWYTEVFGFTKLMEATHPDGTGYVLVLGKPDWSMCVGLHTHPTNPNEPFAETRT
jgi:catechol 2,3-dioxygenase-like lactoylglutathione lyase family enzyme